MSKKVEGKVKLQLKINEETRNALIEMAGGERSVSKFLDVLVPQLATAHKEIQRARITAQRRALLDALDEMDAANQ